MWQPFILIVFGTRLVPLTMHHIRLKENPRQWQQHSRSSGGRVCTCVRTYVRTLICTYYQYLPTYLGTHIHVHTYIRTHAPTHVRRYVRTCTSSSNSWATYERCRVREYEDIRCFNVLKDVSFTIRNQTYGAVRQSSNDCLPPKSTPIAPKLWQHPFQTIPNKLFFVRKIIGRRIFLWPHSHTTLPWTLH